jgi:hypothetical protein
MASNGSNAQVTVVPDVAITASGVRPTVAASAMASRSASGRMAPTASVVTSTTASVPRPSRAAALPVE